MTPAEMAAINRANHPEGLGWTEDGIAALLADPGAFAVVREAGFALVRRVLTEAELLTIDVAREARGKGLGTALLREAMDRAAGSGVETMFLEVAEDNGPALRLYARAGFGEIGRRRSYYRRPGGRTCDAIAMRCDLAGRMTPPRNG